MFTPFLFSNLFLFPLRHETALLVLLQSAHKQAQKVVLPFFKLLRHQEGRKETPVGHQLTV